MNTNYKRLYDLNTALDDARDCLHRAREGLTNVDHITDLEATETQLTEQFLSLANQHLDAALRLAYLLAKEQAGGGWCRVLEDVWFFPTLIEGCGESQQEFQEETLAA